MTAVLVVLLGWRVGYVVRKRLKVGVKRQAGVGQVGGASSFDA